MRTNVWVVTSEYKPLEENVDPVFRVVAAFSTEEKAQEFVAMRLEAWRKAEKLLETWIKWMASQGQWERLPAPGGLERLFGSGYPKMTEVAADIIKQTAMVGDLEYKGESYDEHDLKIKRLYTDPSWAKEYADWIA